MPIKVQTCSATQNDRLNLSFVKIARNGRAGGGGYHSKCFTYDTKTRANFNYI